MKWAALKVMETRLSRAVFVYFFRMCLKFWVLFNIYIFFYRFIKDVEKSWFLSNRNDSIYKETIFYLHKFWTKRKKTRIIKNVQAVLAKQC